MTSSAAPRWQQIADSLARPVVAKAYIKETKEVQAGIAAVASSFSGWVRWGDRGNLTSVAGSKYAYAPCTGVYILAVFVDDEPREDEPADPLDERVRYIGMTHVSLKTRWKQCDAAFYDRLNHKKCGRHPAGWRLVQDDGLRSTDRLFVAALTIGAPGFRGKEVRDYHKLIERACILENRLLYTDPRHLLNRD